MKKSEVLKEKRFVDAKKNFKKIKETIKPFAKKSIYKEVSTSGKWKSDIGTSVVKIP